MALATSGIMAQKNQSHGREVVPRKVLAADKGVVAIADDTGKVYWQYENRAEAHDLHLLPNGNILLPVSRTRILEVTPEKKIVWSYDAKPREGYSGRVEVHAFEPLPDGRVMVAESGNKRIVEVDREGKIAFQMDLTVENPHPHRDTRMARRLDHGGYLVCHEADGKIREYDRSGKVLWVYELDLGGRPRSDGHGPEGHGMEVYGAVRLKNGNTLIGGGNNNRVLEVNTAGKTVWSIDQKELPGITLAWVTTVTALPNGNVIVGNCHAGPGQPQIFEVSRDKLVLWKFMDFKTFGNGLAASQVLDLTVGTIR
jgi:outer membrane protein assembly factor BamB